MSDRADLLFREAAPALLGGVAAREETPVATDQDHAVESTTTVARAPGTQSPRTSPGAFVPLLSGAAAIDAMRGLQRAYGNRYVGRVLEGRDA